GPRAADVARRDRRRAQGARHHDGHDSRAPVPCGSARGGDVTETKSALGPVRLRGLLGGLVDRETLRESLRPRVLFEEYGLVVLLALLVVGISIAQPSFVAGTNLLNLLQQWAPTGLMAITGTFVIIAGGFDFSIGGI